MKHRSFIAINLPSTLKRDLAQLLENLQNTNPRAQIKWMRPEGLHLTLHFLGYLDEEQLKRVGERLKEISQDYSPLSLKIGAFGGFPNLGRPRVIFIELKEVGGNNLAKLQQEVGQALENLGIGIDHRAWQAHITLGRVRVLGELRITNYELRNLKFRVKSVELMESELRREGARYKVVQSYGLASS